MARVLFALLSFLGKTGGSSSSSGGPPQAKAVVWAHNSHLGDARYTEVNRQGELNLGQLVREQLGPAACFNIGFSTNSGTVTAATHWDGEAERKRVRPGMPGSYEHLFHQVNVPRFMLLFRGPYASKEVTEALMPQRLQRAIGVIYRPKTERSSRE